MNSLKDDLKRSKRRVKGEQVWIATKIIRAVPMSWNEWKHNIRCTTFLKEDTMGYRVTYEDGYNSWSPKDTFERCHRLLSDKEKELING